MLTPTQEIAISLILAAIWLGVGALMVMQCQVRRERSDSFKLRMSFSDTAEVIRLHRSKFPKTHFRKVAAYGSTILGVSAGVLALISAHHS